MAQLYTVSFTTQTLVKKLDKRGNIISSTRLDNPVTITALPHATAMSYQKCDNFTMVPYVMEDRRTPKGSGRDNSVGNGTKKIVYQRTEGIKSGKALDLTTSGTNVGKSKAAEAAMTGNLGAALNV